MAKERPAPTRKARRERKDVGAAGPAGARAAQAQRRSGADVSDANGRDSAAHAARKKSRWPRKSKSPASVFAASVLGCNFALQATVRTLQEVHRGALPFDRTIKVSLTERLTKEQIMARMPHNLRTLEHLLEQNRAGLPADDRPPRARSRPRPPAGSGSVDSRRKALTLVEELSLRTRRVQPLVRQLMEMSQRMDDIRGRLYRPGRRHRRPRTSAPTCAASCAT